MPGQTLGHLFLRRMTAQYDGVADAQVAEDAKVMVIEPAQA
jgi:hypothetical protein